MISFSVAYLCVNSCSRRSVTQFESTSSAPTIRLIPFTFAAFWWCSKSLVFTQGFSTALQSQHFCASQYYTAVKNVSSQTHISFPFLKSLWIRGGIPTTHNILSPGTFVYERQINNLSRRSLACFSGPHSCGFIWNDELVGGFFGLRWNKLPVWFLCLSA